MATQLTKVTFPSGDYIDLSGKVSKTGDTMTGTLITPKTRVANTCYGVSFGKTNDTPKETILKTGIKYVSGSHMPVVHITGYAYGLQSPVEFKIGFYIYNTQIGWSGACNMGAWEPEIRLFKYTRDSVDYVAIGFIGTCYFLQLQADVQDEKGKLANVVLDDTNWSWEFYTDTGHIPDTDGGASCCAVAYKANILNGIRNVSINGNYLRVNNNGTNTDLTIPYATSANSANSATTANYVSLVAGNEIRLAGKPSTAQTVYMGYKWSDNTSAALINRWKFCNGNGAVAEVEASTFYGNLNGNATTATTASNLTNFQVSLTGSLGLDISTNSVGYVGGLTRADWNYQMTDGAIYGQTYSAAWKHEIFGDYRTGHMSVRGKNNGTWQPWNLVLDSGNIGYVYSSTVTYNPHERKFITSKSTSAWDAQVYSKQGYIDNVYVSFRPTQANMAMMIGLDSNPSESTGYDKIDYCWYTQNSGSLSIYENNTSIASITGHTTYAAGDELRVEYSGGYVRYYHNGVLCRSVARAIGDKLYMDSSLHGISSTFYDVYFGNSITKASAAATADMATSATTASKLGSSNVGSATNPIYLSGGTATACTYSLNKTVPSDAVFTDQYVSQSATTTSDYRKIVLSYQNGAAGAAVTSNTNVVYVTANAEVQPSTGNIRSAGTVSAANVSATTNVTGVTLGVATTTGTTGGISLYNGTSQVDTYGIAFRLTSNKEKHGYVQGDWATYFTMNSGATTRGWVFRTNTTNGNVASISGGGNAVFNGSVTVGGNTTNTSGVRQVYNSTTKSLDFVFVA